MTDQHEHHEQGQANPKDMSLEAQLDALLEDLEAVEPEMVPKDLRKHQPEPAASKPAEPEPAPPPAEPEPISEAEPEAEPEPAPATEPHAEPAVATTREAQKPAKKGLDLESVASMASNLLDQQVEATIAAAAEQTAGKPAAPRPAEAKAKPPAGEAKPKGPALNEDELGNQIQALLNQVQTPPATDKPQPQEPTEAVPAEGTAEAAPAAQTAAEPVEQDKDTSADPGAVSIEQIDAMLAESAEQAIEQEPEPVSEVPGTDEILAAQARAEDEQARAQQAAEPEPEPTPQPVAEQPQPEPIAGATAEDVARELDEDQAPEPVAVTPEPVTPKPAPKPKPAAEAEAFEPDAVVIHQSALKQAEQRLLRICGTINRPLNRLSPEMKDTVGYVGIVVLLPALCLILYGLLF